LASKKDKLLESAQRFIAKGQLDRAIKDYEQVVAFDPADIRFRQKLAELLVRANRKDEAVGEYEFIGKHYANNTFYLKAIAVYKQIQKLDPGNVSIPLVLGSLNEKQGLIGNALAEYNAALVQYQKSGQLPEAIDVLEKMLAADPDNLSTHLKFAEAYYCAGLSDKAYDRFVRLAVLLAKSGDHSAFRQICARISSLFPDRNEFLPDLMRTLIQDGCFAVGISYLQSLTEGDTGSRELWELLADAYRCSGDEEKRSATMQRMAFLFPGFCVESTMAAGGNSAADAPRDIPEVTGSEDLLEIDTGREPEIPEMERHLPEIPDERETEILPDEVSADEVAASDSIELELTEKAPSSLITEAMVPAGEPAAAVIVPPTAEYQDWEEEIDLSLAGEEVSFEYSPEGNHAGGGTIGAPSGEQEPSPCEECVPAATGADVDEIPFDGEMTEIDLELGDEDAGAPVAGLQDEGGLDLIPGHDFDAESGKREWDADASAGEGDDDFGSLELDELQDFGADVLREDQGGELEDVPGTGDKYGLEGLFSAFKKGIGRQLDQDDTETHYNLGIAYKEMGLYDDAITEFRAASQGSGRAADCLLLQGICYRDKGDAELAEKIFRDGTALAGLTAEESLSMRYELAVLLDDSGRTNEALQLYREIRSSDPAFRDTVRRISRFDGEEVECGEDETELLELDVEEVE